MRLHHLNEKKLKKLNGLTVMSLGQFVDDEDIEESKLNEFAPPSDDSGDDGFSDETLKRLAAQWYHGDEDPRVERTLAAAGWEIGQDEGYDDEPGVFVVQAGDVNGNSYLSWSAQELQGLKESNGHANTLYFFDVEKGGKSFHHLDLKIMGLKQSLKGKWYYQPGRRSEEHTSELQSH